MSRLPPKMVTHYFDPMPDKGEQDGLSILPMFSVASRKVAMLGRNSLYAVRTELVTNIDGVIEHNKPFSFPHSFLDRLFKLAADDKTFDQAFGELVEYETMCSLQLFASNYQGPENDPARIDNIDYDAISRRLSSCRVPEIPRKEPALS